MGTIVRLRNCGPWVRPLNLERTPIYLRFVLRGTDPATFDALDQLDDQAQPGETIIATKMDGRPGFMVVCSRGKGCRREQYADYEIVECRLTQEQLADNDAWGVWCHAEYAKDHQESEFPT